MTSLQSLLKDIVAVGSIPDISINGLSLDSRQIKKGDLFFAYSGGSSNGVEFIEQAIVNGAVAVLCEKSVAEKTSEYRSKVPIIFIEDLMSKIGYIAARFYDNPSRDMFVIGITGTNGKTSCSYLLASALQLLGKKAGVIGTIGFGLIGKLTSSIYTTPHAIKMQEILCALHNQQAEVVVMEVSSHALQQDRVNGVEFDVGVFTNITRDHLDYHENMKAYTEAKQRLFKMPGLKQAIFNLDDPVGMRWFKEFQNHLDVYGYALGSDVQDSKIISAHDIVLQPDGIVAHVETPWGEGEIASTLLGRFNVANLLVVLSVLSLMGYKLEDILKVISCLTTVPGRMQVFGGGKQPLVVIDFAHTPDALSQTLQSLREHCAGQLFCIFGCGGDRDKGKRPLMGEIAERLADKVILADDNVRYENPAAIVDDILSGFKKPELVQVKHDRAGAIKLALKQAKAGDIILLAGKGHEAYNIVKDQRLPFSEKEIVIGELSLD
jgi:UDP-N-acetylmuramoyl-L-alanyl-D-glutamate--2,6-diaminopimelate ligase